MALVALCLMAAFGASAVKRGALTCTGLEVIIKDSLENSFVSVDDIRRYLDSESGGYMGRKLDSIDLAGIERIIDGKSAVLKSEAYMTKDGIIVITPGNKMVASTAKNKI